MLKKNKLKKIVSVAAAALLLALSFYAPHIVSAETQQVTYNYYAKNKDENYVDAIFSDKTLAKFGITSYNGGFNRDNADGLFDTSETYQKDNATSTADTHVVYGVEPGTAFEARFVPIIDQNLENYAKKKNFEIKVFGWEYENSRWTTSAVASVKVTKTGYSSAKKLYILSLAERENIYTKLKIQWPGRVTVTNLGYAALGLAQVTFTPKETDGRVEYHYSDPTTLPMDETKKTGARLDPLASPDLLGMFRISANTVLPNFCSLVRYSKFNGALCPDRDMIVASDVGTAEFYVDYHVEGGSTFTVSVIVDNNAVWGKPFWESLPCYEGRLFEFKFLTSADAVNWELAASTGEEYGKITKDIQVPKDHKYVRVLFPQDGNSKGKGVDEGHQVFNDMALLDGVIYKPGENSIYGKYFDYNAIGARKLDYFDSTYESLMFYRYNGVEIQNYDNGFSYLGVPDAYASDGAKNEKPYVVFYVQPETLAKFTVTKDLNKCAAMGENWDIALFASPDNQVWTPVEAQKSAKIGEGLGENDTYTFTTLSDTNYLKIEFPHNGPVGEENGSKAIGLMNVGISPNEYGKLNPYGNFEFANRVNYWDDAEFDTSMMINSVNKKNLMLHQVRIDSVYINKTNGLQVLWDYLNGRTGNSKPYAAYNVVPGTAFQTEITFNAGSIALIENVLKQDFLPKLYISADLKTWTEYHTSKIKVSASKIQPGKGGLIYTIDEVPEGINYVKIEFPQTGDVSIQTEQAFPWAGNDIMEIAFVAFTRGEIPVPDDNDGGENDVSDSESEDEEDSSSKYVFIAPNKESSNIVWTGDDQYDYGDYEEYDEYEELGKIDTPQAKKAKKKNKQKIIKKTITVIDGYYYPLWVWILWIGGGVLGVAAAVLLIIFLKKRKLKKEAGNP